MESPNTSHMLSPLIWLLVQQEGNRIHRIGSHQLPCGVGSEFILTFGLPQEDRIQGQKHWCYYVSKPPKMAEDRIATSTGPLMASMPRPVLQKTRPLQVQNFGLTLGQAEFDASPLIELFQLDRDTPAEVGRTKWNGTQFSADPNTQQRNNLAPPPLLRSG